MHGSLEVAKASFHSLQKKFLRWLASLEGARGFPLLPTSQPRLKTLPQVSLDQEFEAFEEGY